MSDIGAWFEKEMNPLTCRMLPEDECAPGPRWHDYDRIKKEWIRLYRGTEGYIPEDERNG